MKSSKFLRQKVKNKGRIYFFVSIIICSLAGIFYLAKDFLKIEEVQIEGASEFDVVELYSLASREYLHKSVFEVSDSGLKEFIEKEVFGFEFIKKAYIFPNTLLIFVSQRSEVYIISDSNGAIFSIDSSGYVFKIAKDDAKIDIVYDSPINLGDHLDTELIRSAFLYVSSDGKVMISGNEISINLDNGGKVILPKNVDKLDISRVNEILQKIIQKYRIENRGIEFIDMRFSKPVVKFK